MRGFGGWGSAGFYGVRGGVRWLLVSMLAVFLLQRLSDAMAGGVYSATSFTSVFSLSFDGLRHGCLWQPLTYVFLHANVWHLLVNMLGLFVFGRDVEEEVGTGRFLALFAVCGVVGGAGWLLISGSPQHQCLGASGAVMGLMGAAAAMFPRREITLLVFFVLPVTLTLRMLALLAAGVSVLFLLSTDGQVAHAAHLAGLLAGWLYGLRRVRPPAWARAGRPGARRAVLDFLRRRAPAAAPGAPPPAAEVDAILDKLAKQGIGSLSRRERDTLERASQRSRAEEQRQGRWR